MKDLTSTLRTIKEGSTSLITDSELKTAMLEAMMLPQTKSINVAPEELVLFPLLTDEQKVRWIEAKLLS